MNNFHKSTVTLHPYYVTGFIDGEGCFHLSIGKNASSKIGYSVGLSFSIGLNKKDIDLLKLIKAFFGGIGKLSVINDNVVLWRVRSIEEIKVIIDHIESFPLRTKKRIDFFLLKEAFRIINDKDHIKEEGFIKLVSLKASMNKGLSNNFKDAFPDTKLSLANYDKEIPNFLDIEFKDLDPNWIAGFTEAEGCFFLTVQENTAKGSYQVKIGYQVSQHVRDTLLIKSLIKYFECGRTEPAGKSGISFRVTKLRNIIEVIIPFFGEYPLLGNKAKDFRDWKEIAQLMENKAHLTKEGLNKIKEIKSKMNSLRYTQ